MDLVQPVTPFCFNYVAYDQDASLKVAARIYNVTTGSPVLVTTVPMTLIGNGTYSGNYIGQSGETYLAIAAVFLDSGFTTPDTLRGPWAYCFQVFLTGVTYLGFGYGAFDQNASLNIATSIYDLSTGSAVFVNQIPLVYVELGVYFGNFTGVFNKTYELISVVFTDNTFTTPLNNYSPDAESFTPLILNGSAIQNPPALLSGQKLQSQLVGQTAAAILRGAS